MRSSSRRLTAETHRLPAVTLYGLPGSHPTACVEGALRVKQLPYRRVELLPVLARPWLKLRFDRPTLPAAILQGERIAGSRRIVRRLDTLHPDPPLFPSDDEARARVEEAERWGEHVLQPLARRCSLALARRDPDALASFAQGVWPIVPFGLLRLSMPFVVSVLSRLHGADDGSVPADFATLGTCLLCVDRWVQDGTLGHSPPNAADLQIGASLQLLETAADLQPLLARRSSSGLGADFLPAARGRAQPRLAPRPWIEALERSLSGSKSGCAAWPAWPR
jgi:glutathione S-transferase